MVAAATAVGAYGTPAYSNRPVKALSSPHESAVRQIRYFVPPLGTGGCLFQQRLIDGIVFQLATGAYSNAMPFLENPAHNRPDEVQIFELPAP